ncbi:sensor histidine kinase [Sphaerisporangium perillae]|uniref:sensor histidine kinase n=1 Tax=Sphaerisporangium perillae TaxID=2935860 RepID=UPI00200D3860|nr:HAMP domain-containing sensor histidine kinase [Sphaerisporangium perillae]
MKKRFTIFAGVAAAALCALCATLLMVTIHRLATEYLTNEVTAASQRVAYLVEQGRIHNPIAHSQIRNLQVVDSQGRVVVASKEMQGKPRMATFVPRDSSDTAVVCDRVFPRDECDIVVAQRVSRSGQTFIVYSAAPVVPPLVHPMLATLMLGIGVLLTGLITYGTYRVVRGSMKPVDAIRTKLDEINTTCLDSRVPIPRSEDEIHALAESVNHTLDRLQAAVERQQRFTSDASHDLRTPITAMRAQVEDALLAPDDTSVSEVGSVLLGSLDRLQAIVCDLLLLARLDAGVPCAHGRVDLAELAATELANRPPAKKVECDLEDGVVVMGDRLRLARLLANLVDNAERHADRRITIKVYHEEDGQAGDHRFPAGTAVLEVLDDGAGIAPEKRDSVFQRFVRLDESRARDSGGTGLGLPIARQIAETCSGTLIIEDSPKGARLVLRLPMASTESSPASQD